MSICVSVCVPPSATFVVKSCPPPFAPPPSLLIETNRPSGRGSALRRPFHLHSHPLASDQPPPHSHFPPGSSLCHSPQRLPHPLPPLSLQSGDSSTLHTTQTALNADSHQVNYMHINITHTCMQPPHAPPDRIINRNDERKQNTTVLIICVK